MAFLASIEHLTACLECRQSPQGCFSPEPAAIPSGLPDSKGHRGLHVVIRWSRPPTALTTSSNGWRAGRSKSAFHVPEVRPVQYGMYRYPYNYYFIPLTQCAHSLPCVQPDNYRSQQAVIYRYVLGGGAGPKCRGLLSGSAHMKRSGGPLKTLHTVAKGLPRPSAQK